MQLDWSPEEAQNAWNGSEQEDLERRTIGRRKIER
jgi:hypothetical protein